MVQIYQRCMVSDDTPIPRFYNPTMSANLDDNEHHPLPASVTAPDLITINYGSFLCRVGGAWGESLMHRE